ncbi:hypothetical protein NDU88_003239 [Pleurodeles waltl]|uniref:Uncharacterized protein n=1 Tax=Pleurodeles waltl TaxID=8319 RepID=A0AAV7NG19_PLEWA|nr:hypothetical protein NDU88_003239 [Pleurodeles waltl]
MTANPKPLAASKEGPGGCCAGTRGVEKPADGNEGACDGGLRRAGQEDRSAKEDRAQEERSRTSEQKPRRPRRRNMRLPATVQNLVLPEQRTLQSQVLIACVHGDHLPYPVATVRLNWRGDDKTITVGVIPNLGEDLNLGTDYVDFTSLLEKAGHEYVNNAW